MVTAGAPGDLPGILVLMSSGWSVRNYILSGCLDRVAKRARLWLAVPGNERRGELAAAPFATVALPTARAGRLPHWMEVLVSRAHQYRHANHSLRIGRDRVWRTAGLSRRARMVVLDSLGRVLARGGLNMATRLERRWVASSLEETDADRLLDELRPDLVMTTIPFSDAETPVVRRASARGIPVAAAILSWDNIAAKTRMPVEYDRYFVWSEAMAADLLEYYPEVDRRRVSITGTPQFDFHMRNDGPGREEFCAELGLDPGRPIVTYTASTASLLPGEEWIVEKLQEGIEAQGSPGRPQILVRLHPGDDGRRFVALQRRGVRIVRPWAFNERRPMWSCPTARDMAVFTATLWHTAVNLNFFSTMTLDFCIVDRPVVNVAIQTPRCQEQAIDVAEFYEYEHYRPVLEEAAVRLVRTVDEMLESVAAYLDDPSRDTEGRRRLVARLCGPLDGLAAKRIADELADLAGGRS